MDEVLTEVQKRALKGLESYIHDINNKIMNAIIEERYELLPKYAKILYQARHDIRMIK